jgi:diguanylate cyclase
MGMDVSDPAVVKAQKLRLCLVLWGCVTYGCALIFVAGYYIAGLVNSAAALHFTAAIVLINLLFVSITVSGINLRFKDPSFTFAQIFAALWPSIYVMYHTTDPQARMVFLLMAMVAMLFGIFVLDFRRMLTLSGWLVAAYLLLLTALVYWAPERVNLKVEAFIVIAYAAVLVLLSSLGNVISGLRKSLHKRNRALKAAMAELQDLAMLDPLTRLPNRRSIMEQLVKEQARTERRQPRKNRLCLCLLDIDRFKRINDTYGHQKGDEVLRRVADMLQNLLRKGDFAGRFGGEEFLLILPETSNKAAYTASERIRTAIADMPVPELPEEERITISIGLAIHCSGDKIETTINRADEALYQAKDKGRNQVVFAPVAEDGEVAADHQ